jgi:hypothetical protein
VFAGTPKSILPFSGRYPGNRLGLSQWLFDKKNPLTAKVFVNRVWQDLFGLGLVPTPGDFGMQGALPSHPELLDWLAVDFMENGWDIRKLIKKIMMSATYRQSSAASKSKQEADPENRLLARYPRHRLPADIYSAIDMNHIKNPENLIRAMGPRLKSVHMADGHGEAENHYFPCSGQGSNNWVAILAALHEAQYSGPFLYESAHADVKDLKPCYASIYEAFVKEKFSIRE